MKLLDRYLSRQFAMTLLMVMAALVTIYLLIDFFEKIDNFIEAGENLTLAAKYFLLEIPQIIVQLMPIIILLGGVIVLGLVNHSGEILALKGGGISTLRITFPLTISGVIFSILALALSEWIVPPTAALANKIFHEQVQKERPRGILRGNRFFYRGENGFYSFEKNQDDNNRFDEFIFTGWDENYNLKILLTADFAIWTHNTWNFSGCSIKQKNNEGGYDISNFAKTEYPLAATPEDFFLPSYKIDEMSLTDLIVLAKTNKARRGHEAKLKFMEQVSFSLLGIPLLMLGLPLLLIAHHKWGRDLSLAIPLSCGLAFAAWGGWSVMQSMATAEVINPYVAACSIHVFIAAVGTFLILQEDR